jgi:hypothetical protein
LRAQLASEGNNITKWNDLGLTLGMLGNQPEARTALARARELIAAGHAMQGARAFEFDNALDRAWAGEIDESVTGMARILPAPGAPLWSNVHGLRVSFLTLPLHGDPHFAALLDDPKNNAPLP